MKRNWIWFIPVFISIAVGFVLWDMNNFDVSLVAGAWGVIAAMMMLYGLLISSLSTVDQVGSTTTDEMTPVQRQYMEATSAKSAK